jgi:ABC-2 type transport system permease protein
LLFTALGTAIASKLEDMQGFQLIMNFLVMPTFFLSGALFPLENFPRAIKTVTYFNPLSYGVDGLRGALAGAPYFGFAHDLFILLIAVSILLAAGSYLFSRIEI